MIFCFSGYMGKWRCHTQFIPFLPDLYCMVCCTGVDHKMICVYRKCMREVALPHPGYSFYRFHDTQASPPMLCHHYKHDACIRDMDVNQFLCLYVSIIVQIPNVIGENGVATPTHSTSVIDDWYCIAGYIRNIHSCVGDPWFFSS